MRDTKTSYRGSQTIALRHSGRIAIIGSSLYAGVGAVYIAASNYNNVNKTFIQKWCKYKNDSHKIWRKMGNRKTSERKKLFVKKARKNKKKH